MRGCGEESGKKEYKRVEMPEEKDEEKKKVIKDKKW